MNPTDKKNNWQACIEFLQDSLSVVELATWICPLQVHEQNKILYIGAPNRIVFDEVKNCYLQVIEDFFKENIWSENLSIKMFIIGEDLLFDQESETLPVSKNTNHPIEKAQLNPVYTFSNFIIGKSNQLAEAAAEQVAINPGSAYNPLFLYGSVGLGKTHLMHAIGNKILTTKPGLAVRYVHAEKFVGDVIKAIQTNTLDRFKKFYRQVDVLMIDDIQFFAGKERSQEEFFYTFNNLLESKQQIILSSDRYPRDLGGIADRLKSRFGSGLTVSVEPPELETRIAILLKKADIMHIPLSEEIALFIAQKVRSNVRELEGALKRIVAQSKFLTKDISLDFVQRALKDVVDAQERAVTANSIINTVAAVYKIKPDNIISSSREKKYAWPRQIAMALCKELTNLSFQDIGVAFGGKNHTTVMHACKKVSSEMDKDGGLSKTYHSIVKQLTF